jgi:hypothetical protein
MCVNSLELFLGQSTTFITIQTLKMTQSAYSRACYSLNWRDRTAFLDFPSKDRHCRYFYIFWQKKKNTNKHNSKTIQKLFLFRVLKSAQTWVTNPWILLLYTINLSWNGEGFINFQQTPRVHIYIYIYIGQHYYWICIG